MSNDLTQIVALSLQVSGIAIFFSAIIGIPLGAWLGLAQFPLRRIAIALIYTGMGFPPVVVGLAVYLLLSQQGPLGTLGWLFTPTAMILAQIIIALPLVAGLTMTALLSIDPELRPQLFTLGATRLQATWTLLNQARGAVVITRPPGRAPPARCADRARARARPRSCRAAPPP